MDEKMKLSQTRQAIVEEWKENMRIGLGLDDEDVEVAKNHLTNALNDYTESIVRMVEGIEPKCPITSSEKWAYDQALNDIKEELTNDTK